MNFQEKRSNFIKKWGDISTSWGINRTMGQIHALLLTSAKPLCTDHIMQNLEISRGNACMNLKTLVEWNLIYKECMDGCRKEYYTAEKDMYKIFRQVVIHRRREELDPLLNLMAEYEHVEALCPESTEFCDVLKDIKYFSRKADATLESLLSTDPDWFVGSFLKMFRV